MKMFTAMHEQGVWRQSNISQAAVWDQAQAYIKVYILQPTAAEGQGFLSAHAQR